MTKYIFLFAYLLLSQSTFLCHAQSIAVVDQRCEYWSNPLGIDVPSPHFGWVLKAKEKNQEQTAYELIVSNNYKDISKKKGNVWSTGKVRSSQSVHVEYGGKPLNPFTRYYWRVKVYDKNGKSSEWSDPSWFETAALDPSDWTASWIGSDKTNAEEDEELYKDAPAPLFRKIFKVEKKIKSARLHISGLGYYEADINGKRVGDNVLDPGWTAYRKQVLYSTYDITDHLKQGSNVIGIILGNGWYNPLPLRMWGKWNLREQLTIDRPCLSGMIHITYSDGSKEIIPTDNTWDWFDSPILRNNIYLGEHYDARLETDYTDLDKYPEGMSRAVKVTGPKGKMTAQLQPPIKIYRKIKPIAITETDPGVFVVDMGQNFAGAVQISVKGKAGTCVRLRYGEDIYKDGKINGMTSVVGQIKYGNGGAGSPSVAWQEDSYTLNGNGIETWMPRFTFHGFRYVELTGWPGKPTLDDIEGMCMSADVPQVGEFECSNPMFNKLIENIRWTFRSNLFSVQSDCPAREKFGYGGDILCSTNAFSFNYDMSNFYRKVLWDNANDQRESGAITETIPYMGIADFGTDANDGSGPISFQAGFPFLVNHLYEFYGDKRIIAEHYTALKKLVDYLISCSKDNLILVDISDHESLDEKPHALTASAWYYYHVMMFARFERILGNAGEAEKYESISQQIKQAIVKKMFDASTGVFGNGTQSAQVFGLWFPFIEGKDRAAAFNHLSKAIDAKQGHLSTGIFATKMMFDVFREADRNETAYNIANQKDFPGWGYMIEKGATTLWETWAYSDNTYSQNHPMYGSISEWFYRSILGINPTSPGFKEFIIKPQPTGDLTHAEGGYRSVYGFIASKWKLHDGKMKLNVSVPVNTKATVMIPTSDAQSVTIDGMQPDKVKDVSVKGCSSGYMSIEVGSGDYSFEAAF